MSFNKIGKFFLIFGVCQIIATIFTIIGLYIVSNMLSILGFTTIHQFMSFISILSGLFSIGGDIILLIGFFSEPSNDTNPWIRRMRISLIFGMIAILFYLVFQYTIVPLLCMTYGYSLTKVGYISYIVSIIFQIPFMILTIQYVLWGNTIKRSFPAAVPSWNIVIPGIEIGRFLLFPLLSILISRVFSVYFNNLWNIFLLCEFVCWSISAMMLRNHPDIEEPMLKPSEPMMVTINQPSTSQTSPNSGVEGIYCPQCGEFQKSPKGSYCKSCGNRL